MLTDIFATRYADRKIWQEFEEPERRLLVQSFRILKEQIYPYYTPEGKERPEAKAFWTNLHGRVSMELGLPSLAPLGYSYETNWNGKPHTQTGIWPLVNVCETWMLKEFDVSLDPDSFIKRRLSLVELGFRKRGEEISAATASLEAEIAGSKPRRAYARVQGQPSAAGIQLADGIFAGMKLANTFNNEAFKSHVDELNARFQQAGCKLHYHNGFIQISADGLTTTQVETPFWSAVADVKWANVDTDMKEAIDRRDKGGRDPAWYAARALESTIKIISAERGWTHGGEKGAHNFIDNLASNKAAFLAAWEAGALRSYFTNVRNPFGHGPGEQPMPALSPDQTNWAIENAMSWIKALVRRSSI